MHPYHFPKGRVFPAFSFFALSSSPRRDGRAGLGQCRLGKKRRSAKTRLLQERRGANAGRTVVRPPAPHFPAPTFLSNGLSAKSDGLTPVALRAKRPLIAPSRPSLSRLKARSRGLGHPNQPIRRFRRCRRCRTAPAGRRMGLHLLWHLQPAKLPFFVLRALARP